MLVSFAFRFKNIKIKNEFALNRIKMLIEVILYQSRMLYITK